jgi:hypothetical protein
MNERVRFIAAYLEANGSFVELCEDFGISRKQGYEWRQRHEAGGVAGLAELSRAPHAHPHAIGDDVRSLFVDARNEKLVPAAIRTDNGPSRRASIWWAPFSTLAPGGLPRLAVWWIRLGIRPERHLDEALAPNSERSMRSGANTTTRDR